MRDTTATVAFVGLLLILALLQMTFSRQWGPEGLGPAGYGASEAQLSAVSPQAGDRRSDEIPPYERLKQYKRDFGYSR